MDVNVFYNKRVVLRKLIVFILFFNFFVSFSVAACDIKKLEEKLLSLHLDPEIRTNNQFLLAMEEKYGNEMVESISMLHPHMKFSPDDMIDLNTTYWLESYIWSHKAPNTRYIPVLGDLRNDELKYEYIKIAFTELYDKSKKTMFMFLKKQDYKLFKINIDLNLTEIIMSFYPSTSEIELKTKIEAFKFTYLKDGSFEIGFNNMETEKPVVIITGHGTPGSDSILVGGEELKIEFIVSKLKEAGLKNEATIKLNTCYSGCTKNKVDFSVEEIKFMFKSGILISAIGSVHGSLMDRFSTRLFNDITSFKGEVQGYIGALSQIPQEHVLKMNGQIMRRGNASEITGNNGMIKLKREEVRVSMTRKDFS